ncbi:hypothetical protein ACLMJK_000827 [Lecanora helva]
MLIGLRGWSTTFLNSIGAIYMLGCFNGERLSAEDSRLRRLEFPAAYPQTTATRHEPSTAIKQYSSGRSSILGLADDGKVWMWQSYVGKAVNAWDESEQYLMATIGWNHNSVYVRDKGIIYWTCGQESDLIPGGRRETLAVADMMIIESTTVLGTGYSRTRDEECTEDSLEYLIGQVTAHVVLRDYIVFITDLNKVFYCRTTEASLFDEPIDITSFFTAIVTEKFKIRGLEGAFTQFAVTTDDGEVVVASIEPLRRFMEENQDANGDLEALSPIASIHLSKAENMVSLAFGDHHFLTLHTDGKIKAYGTEYGRRGGLGLGDTNQTKIGKLRGLMNDLEGTYLPHGEGRTVFFEPLMATWLEHMVHQSNRGSRLEHRNQIARLAWADYFEQKGAEWEGDLTGEGDIGAYHVLQVAGGGWSSAALVMMDEEKAEKARKAHMAGSAWKQTGNTYETGNTLSEQLGKAVCAICEWAWELGRELLGLTARDSMREAEGDRTKYIWSDEPFPRLRLPTGEILPAGPYI